MGSFLSAVRASDADLALLFVILALLAGAVAVYLAYVGNYVGALVTVFIAILLLVFGA